MSLHQNRPLHVSEDDLRLITSQDVTAPKPEGYGRPVPRRLITSQDVTAPKQRMTIPLAKTGLITSQDVTAPKLLQAHG